MSFALSFSMAFISPRQGGVQCYHSEARRALHTEEICTFVARANWNHNLTLALLTVDRLSSDRENTVVVSMLDSSGSEGLTKIEECVHVHH